MRTKMQKKIVSFVYFYLPLHVIGVKEMILCYTGVHSLMMMCSINPLAKGCWMLNEASEANKNLHPLPPWLFWAHERLRASTFGWNITIYSFLKATRSFFGGVLCLREMMMHLTPLGFGGWGGAKTSDGPLLMWPLTGWNITKQQPPLRAYCLILRVNTGDRIAFRRKPF